MPRLNSFQVQIKTGLRPGPEAPKFKINGFALDFNDCNGHPGSGTLFSATGFPQSVAHSLVLCGPEEGHWDIEETTVTYQLAGEPPYTVRLGPVTLDHETDMNLWQDRPLPALDV